MSLDGVESSLGRQNGPLNTSMGFGGRSIRSARFRMREVVPPRMTEHCGRCKSRWSARDVGLQPTWDRSAGEAFEQTRWCDGAWTVGMRCYTAFRSGYFLAFFFSCLAARFSCGVLAGCFFWFFFWSMPFMTTSPMV